jgi:hypothetical protein
MVMFVYVASIIKFREEAQIMAKNRDASKAMKSAGGSTYMLGLIGAAMYYLHTTVGFWPSVVGLLKACVWPAFLVYHLLGL